MTHKMEVDKSIYKSIENMVSFITPSSELECKMKENITKDVFTRMIQYCKSTGMHEIIHDDQLDIFCEPIGMKTPVRISLQGKQNISQYCRTNKISIDGENNGITEFITKTKVNNVKSIYMKELGFKIDLRNEKHIDDITKLDILSKLSEYKKGFRYKKRYSYVDKNIRYDFTITKSSQGDKFIIHTSFANSGLQFAPEIYEAEIEYILKTKQTKQTKRKSNTDEAVNIDDLIKGMITLYLVYNQETAYISQDKRNQAIQNYIHLCFGEHANIEEVMKTPRSFFAAPQPVTLEKENLVPTDLGVVSIYDNYTVTEKADGERMLLYVNSDGNCFLIDSRLNFRYTGIKLNATINCVIDGEFITQDKLGMKLCMFGAFDIYYYNSEDVKQLPLVMKKTKGSNTPKSRLGYLKEFEKKIKGKIEDSGISFFVKEFLWEGDIFTNAKTLLQKHASYPYKIDGLIFTPAKLAVGAMYEGQEVTTPYMTWNMVFKYKPPEENTIDFLVKYGSLIAEQGMRMVRELELYVGFNPQQWTKISASSFANTIYKRVPKGYFQKRFEPGNALDVDASSAFVQVTNDKSQTIHCVNGDEIYDNTIVEFAWIDNKWIPNRVRKDKTELFKKQGISRTANDIKAAMSIWKNLQNPITESMITGETRITELPNNEDDDAYYFRSIGRDKMATKSMMDYHNFWIKKKCLIEKYRGDVLFDIACGKAGDLNKWVEVGIKKVIGIDYSRDNIENPIDGAYARTIKKRNIGSLKIIYIPLDGRQILNKKYFESIKDNDEKILTKAVWGIDKPKTAQFAEYYKFIPSNGCDVVSCQFAIHYFFESLQTLRNFIQNVSNNLKPGGYFIGTCLDGNKIMNQLKESTTKEITGKKNGRVIWNIKQVGDNEIEVYMESIGRKMKEYIVDFNVLIDEFAKIDIVLHKPITSFEDEWVNIQKQNQSSDIIKSIVQMSDIEKQYSFMNSYFVFQKQK